MSRSARATLDEAKVQLSAASGELRRALDEIAALPRADKVRVGQRVEDALQRLEAAKAYVHELELSLLDPPDGGAT